jgi:hypothetical protein
MTKQLINEAKRFQELAGIRSLNENQEDNGDYDTGEKSKIEKAFEQAPNMISWDELENHYIESGLTGDEYFAGFEDEFRAQFEGKPVSKEAYFKFYSDRAMGGQDADYNMVNWIDYFNPELARELYDTL